MELDAHGNGLRHICQPRLLLDALLERTHNARLELLLTVGSADFHIARVFRKNVVFYDDVVVRAEAAAGNRIAHIRGKDAVANLEPSRSLVAERPYLRPEKAAVGFHSDNRQNEPAEIHLALGRVEIDNLAASEKYVARVAALGGGEIGRDLDERRVRRNVRLRNTQAQQIVGYPLDFVVARLRIALFVVDVHSRRLREKRGGCGGQGKECECLFHHKSVSPCIYKQGCDFILADKILQAIKTSSFL